MEPHHPPLADEGIIPQQATCLVFDVLRVKRPLPFHIHPLEVFAEAKLITFSDTPCELANVIFEEICTAPARVCFRCLVVAFKASRRPRSFGAERTRFLASPLSRHRTFNSAFVSSVAHQPLGTCLRRIGDDMSAAFYSSVSVSIEVMSSTLPGLVPGIGGASSVAIAFCKLIRSCGFAINLGRSIARRLLMTPSGKLGAMRPKRRIFPMTRLWSDSAFSRGGVRTVTLRTDRLSTCRVSM